MAFGEITPLEPTDDAYVVANTEIIDETGLSERNYGDKDFLKLWYAFHSPGAETSAILSHGYLKFDLVDLSADNIQSAKLKMYPISTLIQFESIEIGVHTTESNWSESSITYNDAPQFDVEPVAVAVADGSEKLYEWDITDLVKEHTGEELSLVLIFREISDFHEEFVSLASKEYANPELRPILEIEKVRSQELSGGGDFGVGIAAGIVIGAGGVAGIVVFMKKIKIKISKE